MIFFMIFPHFFFAQNSVVKRNFSVPDGENKINGWQNVKPPSKKKPHKKIIKKSLFNSTSI